MTEQEWAEHQRRVRISRTKAGWLPKAKEKDGGSRSHTSPFAPYANKWEFNHAKVLELELRAGAIKSWTYETITFRLAYRQYHRSDFVIGHNDRTVEIRQIKGWHPNLRAGIKGLKWAAQKYPMFTWTIKWWTGTGWDGKYVEV
jgi:hypothetical protein